MIIEKTVKMKGAYVEADLDGKNIHVKVAGNLVGTGPYQDVIPEIQKRLAIAKGIQIELEFLLKETGNMPMDALSASEVAEGIKAEHEAADQAVKPEQRNDAVRFLPEGKVEISCVAKNAGAARKEARRLLWGAAPTYRVTDQDNDHGVMTRDDTHTDGLGNFKYQWVVSIKKRKAAYTARKPYHRKNWVDPACPIKT